jgi:hypothetical protein
MTVSNIAPPWADQRDRTVQSRSPKPAAPVVTAPIAEGATVSQYWSPGGRQRPGICHRDATRNGGSRGSKWSWQVNGLRLPATET